MANMRETWRADTWVRPFFRRYKRVLAASIGLGVATVLFAMGLMFMSGYLITAAAAPPYYGLFELLVPIGLVQLFGVGKPFLGYLERLRSHDWIMRTTSELRRRLYRSLEQGTLTDVASRRIGSVLGLLSEDIAHVQNLYLRTVFPLLIAWISGGVIVFALGWISLPFACGFLVGILCITVLLPLLAVLRDGALQEQAKAKHRALHGLAFEQLSGVADWRYADRRDDFVSAITHAGEAVATEDAVLRARSRRRSLVLHLVFGLGTVGVFVWAAWHFGGSPSATGVLTPLPDGSGIASGAGATANWIAAFVLGLFPLLEVFAPLTDACVTAAGQADAINHLNRLPEPPARVGEKGATEKELPAPAEPGGFDLSLRNVTFRYPEATRDVVRDLTLDIPEGQKVAILGASGTGKSTLASLIRGDLVPLSGAITLGVVDPAALNTAGTIHHHVGLMQQSGYLFNQSLLGNLKIGKPSVTEEEATTALNAVGLGNYLSGLPHGLLTLMDEAGIGLSGGEARRITLARLLLSEAPVILLDEPCVNLDAGTEALLMDTILDTFAERTVVMITHHPAGTERFDRVLYLRDGRIALDGSPAALMRESEFFANLVALDKGL